MKAIKKRNKDLKGRRIIHLWHDVNNDTFCGMRSRLNMANYWFGESREDHLDVCPRCAARRAEELAQCDQVLDDWETERAANDRTCGTEVVGKYKPYVDGKRT